MVYEAVRSLGCKREELLELGGGGRFGVARSAASIKLGTTADVGGPFKGLSIYFDGNLKNSQPTSGSSNKGKPTLQDARTLVKEGGGVVVKTAGGMAELVRKNATGAGLLILCDDATSDATSDLNGTLGEDVLNCMVKAPGGGGVVLGLRP